jgi:hypothetical protein
MKFLALFESCKAWWLHEYGDLTPIPNYQIGGGESTHADVALDMEPDLADDSMVNTEEEICDCMFRRGYARLNQEGNLLFVDVGKLHPSQRLIKQVRDFAVENGLEIAETFNNRAFLSGYL